MPHMWLWKWCQWHHSPCQHHTCSPWHLSALVLSQLKSIFLEVLQADQMRLSSWLDLIVHISMVVPLFIQTEQMTAYLESQEDSLVPLDSEQSHNQTGYPTQALSDWEIQSWELPSSDMDHCVGGSTLVSLGNLVWVAKRQRQHNTVEHLLCRPSKLQRADVSRSSTVLRSRISKTFKVSSFLVAFNSWIIGNSTSSSYMFFKSSFCKAMIVFISTLHLYTG